MEQQCNTLEQLFIGAAVQYTGADVHWSSSTIQLSSSTLEKQYSTLEQLFIGAAVKYIGAAVVGLPMTVARCRLCSSLGQGSSSLLAKYKSADIIVIREELITY